MPQIQICPQGHRWDPAADPRPAADDRFNRCPVCGGPPEMFSLRDTAGSNGSATPAPGPSPVPAEPPGVPGFEVLDLIGRGGMGVVYRARQSGTGRLVALKVLTAGPHASPTDLTRFRVEAEAAARLDHPHIVRLYAVGEHNDLPFMALEYMDRGSLASALANSPLPARYAAELVELLARAVQAAHEQGIVHRDLKPANVLLTSSGEGKGELAPSVLRLLGVPKVTDFGLAKRLDADDHTRTGAVIGTASYMAPEQAEGKAKRATPAVDVYALGAILYECLTGRPPFKGATMLETLDQVRGQEAVPPDKLVPGLPRDLVTVCQRAMAKDPSERYASAGELADDLGRFLDGEPIRARPVRWWEKGLRWVRRRPVEAGVSAVLLLATGLLAGGASELWRHERARRRADEDARRREEARRLAEEEARQVRAEYYAHVIKRWGAPVGVGRLTEARARRRDLSYRLLVRGGVVEAVEAVDRQGRLSTEHHYAPYLERSDVPPRPRFAGRRACRWEYQRDGQGELAREVAYDRAGTVVWTFHFATKTVGYFRDQRGFPHPRAGSGAAFVSFVYTRDGLARELRYLGPTQQPRSDRDGIFGQRREFDDRGLITAVSFLGSSDQPVLHPDGYAKEVREHDAEGNRTAVAYLGLDGKPVLGPQGYAREAVRYDADGNPVEWRRTGLDGKPVERDSVRRAKYDGRGLRVREEIFDGNGEPAHPVARVEYRYDRRGRQVEEAFFGPDGKPARHARLWCVRHTTAYDDDGNVAQEHFHGWSPEEGGGLPEGPPAPRVKRRYDARGRVVEVAYHDDSGGPVADAYGVHRGEVNYDERGRRVGLSFFGPDGKRVSARWAGRPRRGGPPGPATPASLPARLRWTWDDRGNVVELAAFDEEDRPLRGSAPAVGLLFLYGVPNEPGSLVWPELTATVRCEYDDRGNRTEVAFFGPDGRLTEASGPPGRFARVELKFDEHGYPKQVSYFDRRDRPVNPGRGILGLGGGARIESKYREDGRLLELARFDADGKPLANDDGSARYRFAYDGRGNRTRVEFVGPDGRPVRSRYGCARAEFAFDASGKLTGTTFLDREGNHLRTRAVVRRDEPAAGGGGLVGPPTENELQHGDVLLRYKGEPVDSVARLIDLTRNEDFGRPPQKLEVLRRGERRTLRVRTGPVGGPRTRRWNPLGSFGVVVSTVTLNEFRSPWNGVVVETRADPGR
jgi:YD repeat-containing protein